MLERGGLFSGFIALAGCLQPLSSSVLEMLSLGGGISAVCMATALPAWHPLLVILADTQSQHHAFVGIFF